MNYLTAILPNGLRVIELPSTSPVVYCGYQIAAGARDESPEEEGLAHFCEHMTFKGTQHRRAWNILNCMEVVGGSLNAYTTKENTVFYTAVPMDYIGRAVDLLTDIVFHSVYPQKEIDKEVEVICDEIESYNDSPADLIYDDFENIVFDGLPLGHNILGTTERVRGFKTEDALRFTRQHYKPENAVFFITAPETCLVGDSISRKLMRAFDKYGSFGKNICQPLHQDTLKMFPVDKNRVGTTIVRRKDTHQAHVMIGSRSYGSGKECRRERNALFLLNNIIGGRGMNARLNVELREKRGLVYTVESSMTTYGETGLWCTYLGCDVKDINRCIRLTRRQLDRLTEKPLTERQLAAAKKQLKGQISVDCDNRENFILDSAAVFLFKNIKRDLHTTFRDIDSVTADDVLRVARSLFDPDAITTLVYK